jgi:transposase
MHAECTLGIDSGRGRHYKTSVPTTSEEVAEDKRRIAALEAALAASRTELEVSRTKLATAETKLAQVMSERDKLRRAYEQLKEQLELLRRRIFVAKAERADVRQLEIEFATKSAELAKLAASLHESASDITPPPPADDTKKKRKKRSQPPKGRRDLAAIEMPEERIEIFDPELEGQAERIGFEESFRLGHRRAGPVRIVVARATYKQTSDAGDVTFTTVKRPRELFERCLLAPSMFAHILMLKYGFGVPFYRCEQMLAKDGIALGRGEMCRYAEDAGATLGAIVLAMRDDAMKTAFCLATDATGVSIQPEPLADGGRQPCRKGHFFVVLADRDHVFFEYQPKHTSKAACEMFRGYSGFIQADASAIYDALYRGEAVDSGVDPPIEVACWSHARRKFWEAAAAKHELGREGLMRIRVLFEQDTSWEALPPEKILALRQRVLKPLVDDFFAWCHAEHERLRGQRGLVLSAFGYALHHEQALRRFLDDGRLVMTNNRSENALRTIAIGRKNWLFFGSDDHAEAAANLFSLIASCKLHGLDAETYLAEIIRVMPYWPRDRYLELAPKYWTATRARLDAAELARQVGELTVPSPEK